MSEEDSVDQGALTWIERLSRFFNQNPRDWNDVLMLLRDASSKGMIDAEILSIIEGGVQVSKMQVRDVMIPRSRMICVEEHQPLEELLPKIIETAHSRYPVIGATKDEIIGILLAKDLLPMILDKDDSTINTKIRTPTFIPESKRLNILLQEFRTNRNHMAIVLDEFGGVAGLVTIEDVLEQIVGNIEDEHDIDEDSYIKPLDNITTFLVKALTPIDEFNTHFKTKFDDHDVDTIGGILMQQFSCVPKGGDCVTIESLRFEIINADSRKIILIKVSILRS